MTPTFSDLNAQTSRSFVSSGQVRFLQNLWESISYGIFTLDVLKNGAEFRYTAFNPAIARSSPIPVEQLLGRTVTEALPPAMAKIYQQHYSNCVSSGQAISFEEHFCHNGQETWWLLTVTPLRNHNTQIDQLLVTATDISKYKATEAALAESEAKFRSMIEDANDVIGIWGLDGILTYLSPGFQALFGYAPSEWLGQSFVPMVHSKDLPACMAANQQVAETGEKLSGVEFRNRHKNGHWVWVSINLSPVKDTDGKVIAFQGILRDISDRKRTEQEQARLLAILEATSDFVSTADPNGQVLYFNQAARKMLGLKDAESLVGRSLTQNHPDWVNQLFFDHALPEAIQTGSWIGETALLGADGQELPLSQLILAHKSEAGEVEYFSTIARDISESKRQENALRFIVEGTISKTGDEFFRTCVQHLAEICQVQYAFITELVDETQQQSRMLALWTGESFVEPYEFDLAGTPCSVVFQESWGGFPDTIQTQFPQASALATLGAESYLGIVIVDSQGRPIGNLGIIHTEPLADNLNTAKFILQIFAGRVGAEMERKAAENKLQEQEEFLRTVYEGANQPIFVVDVLPDGEFRYVGWNAAAEAVSGMPSQDISGKTPEEIYGVEAGAIERQRLQECLISGQAASYEECLTFEGQETWWVTTHNPLKDSQGKVYRFIGTTFEISDRKAAEAVLQDYADRQTLLNQLANQIRNSLDLDTVIATTIQSIREFLNIDHCAFAWYDPDSDPPIWEMIQEAIIEGAPSGLGRYPATFVGPVDQVLLKQQILQIDDASQYEEPIHRAFLNTIHAQSEILLPIQTHASQIGVIICVNHHQVRLWTDSEVELLKAVSDQLAIAIDQAELYAESRAKSQKLKHTLKELKRTQAQIVQSEKMSSLGQLVAGIAHEINNPVNFIHGNLSHARDYTHDLLDLMALYQREYPTPTPAIANKIETLDLEFIKQDLPKLLNSMKVGTERIREIVRSLRLFSRLDEAEVKAVDIHEGIDSTLMILHNRTKAKADRPEIQILKNYGNLPQVECHAGQLNQVFMNILVNAIDALEEGFEIHTAKAQDATQNPLTISISTSVMKAEWVEIKIADNGSGMPKSVQQRIFDPFFTTKPVGKGTGMGMSISYQIITEKHRGKLECASTLGKGTEFVIQIPIWQSGM